MVRKFYVLKFCLVLLSVWVNKGRIFAQKPSVLFDFERSTVTVFGIFKSESIKSGLESEVAARKNGVQTMTEYLGRECKGTPTLTPKSNIQIAKALKSQGSEIYANGTLRIILLSPLKNIFESESAPQTLKAGAYQNIAFKLPQIPGDALDCGNIPFDVGTDNPISAHFVATTSSFDHVIQLAWNDKKQLRAFSPEDREVIKKAAWTQTIFPVVNREIKADR